MHTICKYKWLLLAIKNSRFLIHFIKLKLFFPPFHFLSIDPFKCHSRCLQITVWCETEIFKPVVQFVFPLPVLCFIFIKQFITMIILWVLMHHLLILFIRLTESSQVKQNLGLLLLNRTKDNWIDDTEGWLDQKSFSICNQSGCNEIKEVFHDTDNGNLPAHFRQITI